MASGHKRDSYTDALDVLTGVLKLFNQSMKNFFFFSRKLIAILNYSFSVFDFQISISLTIFFKQNVRPYTYLFMCIRYEGTLSPVVNGNATSSI